MEVEPPQILPPRIFSVDFSMKKDINKQKKIFVGLSGGVDSSVAATLLKKQGYNIVGVFIKVWQPDFVKCQWKEDRLDAMRVCAILDAPFLELDLEKEYKRDVFDYMVSEYKNGRTPNPDVMCNKKIKFGVFLDFALKNGADFIATGHYVRLKGFDKDGQNKKLLAGIDQNKDQSYFLWSLTQQQLKYCLFPIGGYTKPQVRKLAEKFGLPTARKKDSQGLCFVGKVEMKDFLKRFIPQKSGDVLNQRGKVIGRHDGVCYYTLGQRHGFEIIQKGVNDKPYYIIAKDLKKNTLMVSMLPNSQPNLVIRWLNSFSHRMAKFGKWNDIEIKDVNWIFDEEPDMKKKYSARIRYRQSLQLCSWRKNKRGIFIKFDTPQRFAASGQSLVIYDGKICLGGGIITGK